MFFSAFEYNNFMANNSMTNILKSVEELYLKKQYDEALDALLKHKDSFDSGLFHYNLGSVYLKMGNVGAARYNLEKSKDSGFSLGLVNKNINIIKQNVNVVGLEKSDSIYEQAIGFSINKSSYLVGTVFLLCAIVVLLLAIFKKIKSWSIIIGLLLFLSIPVSLKVFVDKRFDRAVALRDLSLHEGPSKIYEESGEIRAGSKVIIGKSVNGWLFVKYPESVAGWVKRDDVGLF
jgi:hypothetical protein